MAKVKLKTKKLSSGRLSYFISFYDSGSNKRWKEYLGLYLICKPKNPLDKLSNNETKTLAEKIHSTKMLEFQEGRFGFKSKDRIEITFISCFETIMEIKRVNTG